MSNVLYLSIFSVLILVGALSFLLLIFPGHIFILVLTIVYGFVDKWEHLKPWEFTILAGLVGVMVLIDYFSGLLGAKMFGASKSSLIWGVVGLIIGIISWPPFGGLVGLFLGVLIGELISFKEITKAFKAASGSVIGVVAGLIINIILGLGYLGLFIWFAH